MRAVRLTGARSLELVDIPEPVAGPGYAVVRVVSCGVCGSDLSCYSTGVFAGTVLGHEIGGIVETVGPNVTAVKPGDRVAVDPKTPCGSCVDCICGAPHRCATALTGGIGMTMPGGFAERVLGPVANLHVLPDSVTPEDACLVEPLSCAMHGLDRAGAEARDSAVVVGLGPIGLLTVAALRHAGLKRIVGVDPVDERRALASQLGASEVASPDEPVGPAPLVAECSGKAVALQPASNLVTAGGRLLLLGVPMTEASVTPLVWVAREITLIGSIASTVVNFTAAIALLAETPEIASIITRRIPLEDVPKEMEALSTSRSGGKLVVTPA